MRVLLRLVADQLRDRGLKPKQVGSAAAFIAAIVGIATRIAWRLRAKPLAPISLSYTLRLLQERAVQELVYTDGSQLVVQLKAPQASPGLPRRAGARYVTRLVPGSEEEIFKLARQVPSFRYLAAPRGLGQVFSALLPFLFIFIWYRVVKSLISKDEKFSPRPRRQGKQREAVTFADVASKCKVELAEIVDFLNRPKKYKEVGARLPRGALLVGPSGTGKTLLAKAVAGEARCAFISTSASEFVEVYVGRGAARVRDLFHQAREAAPAVLFMDELDALGNRGRSGDMALRGPNEEYVQLLNQLLSELDGFHGHDDGIVIIGATNRHEAIDPALLRPGRFDRHIFVELPDEEERFQILDIHAKRAPMFAKLDPSALRHVAKASAGFSGAELANVVNEAIFLALREKTPADVQHLAAALGRAQTTRQRASPSAANMAQGAGLSRGFLINSWPAVATAP